MSTILSWPEEDRPVEKLMREGESALTDAELVAICLKTTAPSYIQGKSSSAALP